MIHKEAWSKEANDTLSKGFLKALQEFRRDPSDEHALSTIVERYLWRGVPLTIDGFQQLQGTFRDILREMEEYGATWDAPIEEVEKGEAELSEAFLYVVSMIPWVTFRKNLYDQVIPSTLSNLGRILQAVSPRQYAEATDKSYPPIRLTDEYLQKARQKEIHIESDALVEELHEAYVNWSRIREALEPFKGKDLGKIVGEFRREEFSRFPLLFGPKGPKWEYLKELAREVS